MRGALAGVLSILALPSLAVANCLDSPTAPLPTGAPLTISAREVEIPAERLAGLVADGAWSLSSDNADFGGLSGLHIQQNSVLAVTDKGHLFQARMTGLDGAPLVLADALLTPLFDALGPLAGREAGDAEGLALYRGKPLISFEREHRIAALGAIGELTPCRGLPDFANLGFNSGLEGLAAFDGGVIALAEGPSRGQSDYWIIRPDLTAEQGRLTLPTNHLVTGADVGPDGRLYLVLRTYTPVIGVSLRLVRFALDDGHPVPKSAEILAEFEGASGIDNMEAISVTNGPDGLHLWLLSDDNFNFVQRNLLMRFRVE